MSVIMYSITLYGGQAGGYFRETLVPSSGEGVLPLALVPDIKSLSRRPTSSSASSTLFTGARSATFKYDGLASDYPALTTALRSDGISSLITECGFMYFGIITLVLLHFLVHILKLYGHPFRLCKK